MDHVKEVTVLLIAGFFGSLTRLVLNPEPHWRRWLVRFIVGVSCAVFLGGVVSQLIAKTLDLQEMERIFSASGFICGMTAEQLIEKIQNKMDSRALNK